MSWKHIKNSRGRLKNYFCECGSYHTSHPGLMNHIRSYELNPDGEYHAEDDKDQEYEKPECGCGRLAAGQCPNSSCSECCPGCERHENNDESSNLILDESPTSISYCGCGQQAAKDCEHSACGTCCSGCSRHRENSEGDSKDDDWVPDCENCSDDSDVVGPVDEDGDYYCNYCELYVSVDNEDWVPDCSSCEDDEDVSGPDEDGDYHCSHCDHYIDDDGDCIDDDCDCEEEDYHDEYEQETSNTNLRELVEELLLHSINKENWIIFNQQQMKSISGVINQVDITLKPKPQNGQGELYISCIGSSYGPFETTDIDSIQRMWEFVGGGRKMVLLESGVKLTVEVQARAYESQIEIYEITQPLPSLVLGAIR